MDRAKARAFVDEFMTLTSGATTIGLLAIADRSGLLRSMRGQPLRPIEEVASEAGLDLRYTLEILSGLAAARIVDYDPITEGFALSDEHAAVLADDASPYSMTGWLDMIPAAFGQIDGITQAVERGGGVPFEDFDPSMVRGIDRGARPSMRLLLTRRWLPTMPDIVERLEAGGRVADIGCGSGSAVVAMASAFPNAEVIGFDISPQSIERATSSERPPNATFVLGDSTELTKRGRFDLVTAFDVVHDLARPAIVLADINRSISDGGAFMMMEPRIQDDLADNINDRAAALYGISTLHCMTQSLAQGGAGLGAAAGPAVIENLCRQAGFTSFEELPIDNPFSAFFRAG